MNWRKYFAALLAMCMLFVLVACGQKDEDKQTEPSQTVQPTDPQPSVTKPTDPQPTDPQPTTPQPGGETSQISPLLYQVEDSNGNVAWLFGSIHIGEEYFYPLPDYVISAYEGADALAVEFDIVAFEKDMSAQMEMAKKMYYQDGTTIKDHISAELYNKAVEVMEDCDMYAPYMDLLYPIMWSQLIENAVYEKLGINYDLGIDQHMLDRAYKDGKKILDVESAEFQYSMLVNYSAPLQSLLPEESVASYYAQDEVKATADEMLSIWAGGNEQTFWEFLDAEQEFETQEEADLYAEYVKAMETDRNIGMADFVEDSLASGEEVFVCVGAAHVVGADAMVELLRERGYTVTLVK